MPFSKFVRALTFSTLAVGASVVVTSPAEASEVFPAALAEAAGIPCTPSCAVCHGKVPGDITSYTARKLSRDLFLPPVGALPPPKEAGVPLVKSQYAAYAAKASMDPEIARVVAALKAGTDPETGVSLCGPVYGCTVAPAKKESKSDASALLWVAGAMVVSGLLRRRK